MGAKCGDGTDGFCFLVEMLKSCVKCYFNWLSLIINNVGHVQTGTSPNIAIVNYVRFYSQGWQPVHRFRILCEVKAATNF